ncbi:non-homologous end-joining factor 1-like isoform X2 [Daphnia pulex]|uniref:non-homologous end-joining factor 1-like isoform X2 n=1 Tax=Daphnia pulex TaxID=6669 RepID=UPI001EDF7BC5|nr:non-homologous end-joining factor 1-like isoform X2 [Daphnia pulex]
MDALGWFVIGSEGYAVRAESDDENFVIYLTDMTSIWCERQTATEIMKRCQELNPLIESTVKHLIQQLRTLLNSYSESNSLTIVSVDQNITLKLESHLDGNLPFSWEFHLTLETADQFQSFIIRPLLAMLREAACVEEELCNIIRSKDKQIDDYKASGATVSRRHLETKEFNAETFFASRITRTIEESAKEKITSLFCRVVDRLKQLYSVAVERIYFQSSIARRSALTVPDVSAELTEEIPNRGQTSTQSPAKESEESRSEAIKKRLREEEQKEMAKRAKKACLAKIL